MGERLPETAPALVREISFSPSLGTNALTKSAGAGAVKRLRYEVGEVASDFSLNDQLGMNEKSPEVVNEDASLPHSTESDGCRGGIEEECS